MATTQSKILEAAARNAELLSILKETDNAVPDLANQNRYIADLELQSRESAQRISALDRKRTKELKEHEKYRDSVMRRFAFKATGKKDKFDERAAKEEREYFDVLQEEHREKEMAKNLAAALDDARRAAADLDAHAARHTSAQSQLDGLYNAIFSGPSPSYPEEDAREADAAAALQAYQTARGGADAEAQALRLLTEAQRRMHGATLAMEDALRASRHDMWGGGSFSDMMERNALHQAEMQVGEARMLVLQAQRMSSRVRNLPPVQIAQGSLMSDVFFDNIFTDMAFHDKIKQSTAEVHRCADALSEQVRGFRGRQAQLEGDVGEKQRLLEASRLALQRAREAAFERTVGGDAGGSGSGAPPAYSA